jgi:hypothetical protein
MSAKRKQRNTAIDDADDSVDSGSDSGGISSEQGSSEDISVHEANVGDRYIIPAANIGKDDGDGDTAAIAVKVHRGTTELQFAGDDKPGRYKGRLQDWSTF